MKKLAACFLAVIFLMISLAPAAFADTRDLYDRFRPEGGIINQVTTDAEYDEIAILEQIDEKVSNVVATVRVVFTILAVIFVIWVGIIIFTSGSNPQKLASAKTYAVLFLVSTLCIFAAEPIARFVLSWWM